MYGFIIAPRCMPNDEALAFAYHTFAHSPREAWRRFVGPKYREPGELPRRIQAWSQRGYGPFRVKMTVLDESDQAIDIRQHGVKG